MSGNGATAVGVAESHAPVVPAAESLEVNGHADGDGNGAPPLRGVAFAWCAGR